MQIRLAHLHDQGIDFAVFDADAVARTTASRATLLAQLTFPVPNYPDYPECAGTVLCAE